MYSTSLILILSVVSADTRYYIEYDNHREYTKYDHDISESETIGVVIGILVVVAILVCFFCRKVTPDEPEEDLANPQELESSEPNSDQFENKGPIRQDSLVRGMVKHGRIVDQNLDQSPSLEGTNEDERDEEREEVIMSPSPIHVYDQAAVDNSFGDVPEFLVDQKVDDIVVPSPVFNP